MWSVESNEIFNALGVNHVEADDNVMHGINDKDIDAQGDVDPHYNYHCVRPASHFARISPNQSDTSLGAEDRNFCHIRPILLVIIVSKRT